MIVDVPPTQVDKKDNLSQNVSIQTAIKSSLLGGRPEIQYFLREAAGHPVFDDINLDIRCDRPSIRYLSKLFIIADFKSIFKLWFFTFGHPVRRAINPIFCLLSSSWPSSNLIFKVLLGQKQAKMLP